MEEEKEGETNKNKRWFDECLWACSAFARVTKNDQDTAALQTVSHLVT